MNPLALLRGELLEVMIAIRKLRKALKGCTILVCALSQINIQIITSIELLRMKNYQSSSKC